MCQAGRIRTRRPGPCQTVRGGPSMQAFLQHKQCFLISRETYGAVPMFENKMPALAMLEWRLLHGASLQSHVAALVSVITPAVAHAYRYIHAC